MRVITYMFLDFVSLFYINDGTVGGRQQGGSGEGRGRGERHEGNALSGIRTQAPMLVSLNGTALTQ